MIDNQKPIVVIGAGLCGLSTAYFSKKPVIVLEKDDVVGGLCHSYTEDGFTFDYTGHLLHLKDPLIEKLVKDNLEGNLDKIARNAAIYSHGRYTPYPFQAHTHGLPLVVVKDCLLGFINTLLVKKIEKDGFDDYAKWVDRTFGQGIASHFMIPYNKKLWRRDLCELSTDWVEDYIPKPTLEMIIDGALGIRTHNLGYNAFFYYPKTGGIQSLVDGFAKSVEDIRLGEEVTSIDIKSRSLITTNGNHIEYEYLVSTIPLNKLISLIQDKPRELSDKNDKLEYISVIDFNLGISRDKVSPYHWIYFPEDKFNFYRCGFPSNFSKSVAPKGTSSIYIEISVKKGEKIDLDIMYKKVIEGLIESGIIKNSSEVIHKSIRVIDVAYVVYNHDRAFRLPKIHEYLKENKIFSIGRYGSWEYSAMEEAIIWGKEIASLISTL
jgi:protoporphyrinogen oxidase